MGGTCKLFSELAGAADLWRPALSRFFDGEVPPVLVSCADPRQALRTQVLCARRLVSLERDQRLFQVAEVDFPDSREWMKALDAKVAEAQIEKGVSFARPGVPYYGCSGGAYTSSVRAYGRFAKGVLSNGTARGCGILAEATRLTVWVELPRPPGAAAEGPPGAPEAEAAPGAGGSADGAAPAGEEGRPAATRRALASCDYGPLAEWRDRKLAELAAAAGHAPC